MKSSLKTAINNVLQFNYHILTKSPDIIKSLYSISSESISDKDREILEENGLSYEFIIESSFWTYVGYKNNDKNENKEVKILNSFESIPSGLKTYSICCQVINNNNIYLPAYIYLKGKELHVFGDRLYDKRLLEKREKGYQIFICYSGQREKFVAQLSKYLEKLGNIVLSYKDQQGNIRQSIAWDIKDGYQSLLNHTRKDMENSDIILFIEDNYANSSIYYSIEKEFRWDYFNDKSLILNLVEPDKCVKIKNLEKYDMEICACHWPRKFRELIILIRTKLD